MLASSWRTVISIGMRVALSFVCLLLADALFSLLFALLGIMSGSASISLAVLVFRVTLILALPAWCVWLLIVIATKNTEGRDTEWRKIWTILLSGILIGPASIVLRFLILVQRGADAQMVWHGDPLLGDLGGGVASMIFALIVGSFTSFFYVAALKVLHRRPAPI